MASKEKDATKKITEEEVKTEKPKTVPVKRLYRSEENREIAGVAGGLSEYFNFDVTVIRLLFILTAVFGGSGLIAYFIMWLVIPSASRADMEMEEGIKENVEEMKVKAKAFSGNLRSDKGDEGRWIWGVFLLALGVIFLLKNFGLWEWFDFGRFWPVILVLLGLLMLSRK